VIEKKTKEEKDRKTGEKQWKTRMTLTVEEILGLRIKS
jgi:hypothetical protein